jgi:hypothetical protein
LFLQTAVDREEEEKRGRSVASPTKKKSKSGAFMTGEHFKTIT